MLKFKINDDLFIVVEVQRENGANGYAIFKGELQTPKRLNYPIEIAQNPIDLQRVLKRLFLKEVYKPLIKR